MLGNLFRRRIDWNRVVEVFCTRWLTSPRSGWWSNPSGPNCDSPAGETGDRLRSAGGEAGWVYRARNAETLEVIN